MNKSKLLAASLLAALAACDPQVGPGRWDNPLDPDGSSYHPPTISLNDTAIRNASGGRIAVHASSQNSTISSIRWIRNDTLLPTTDTLLSTDGWNDGWHALSAQGVDANGVSSQVVKIGVWIGNRLPQLQPQYSPTASAHAPTPIRLSAVDPDGTVTSIAWDIVPDRYAFDTREFELSGSAGTRKSIYAKAVDNDGATVTAEFSVLFAAAPVVRVAPDLESSAIGTSFGSGASWTVLLASSELPIVVGARIPGIPEASLQAVVREGGTTYPCTVSSRIFPGGSVIQDEQRFSCSVDAPGTGPRALSIEVVSSYGDTATAALSVTVQR